jgi:hypothetical protein
MRMKIQVYDRGGVGFERECEIKNEKCESQCITLLEIWKGSGAKSYMTNEFFLTYIIYEESFLKFLSLFIVTIYEIWNCQLSLV